MGCMWGLINLSLPGEWLIYPTPPGAGLLADYQVEPTPDSTLYAITMPGVHLPPQVKAFVQFLADTVKTEFSQ